MRRLARSATLALVAIVVWAAIAAPSAPAAGPNRAAIVVDTGSEVKTACVEFNSDSISGIEALRRAGFAPSVRSFGGIGGAVCMLCGKGCPTDGSCLTCDSPNYWAYHRGQTGSGGFSMSGAGAGATKVRNGDVEGWRFGSGAAPAFRSFESICSTSRAAPPPAAERSGGDNAGTGGPSRGSTSDAASADSGSADADGQRGSTGSSRAEDTGQAGAGEGANGSLDVQDSASGNDAAPNASAAEGGGAGSAEAGSAGDGDATADVDAVAASDRVSEGAGLWSLIGFAMFAVVIAAAVIGFRVHKRRARAAPGS